MDPLALSGSVALLLVASIAASCLPLRQATMRGSDCGAAAVNRSWELGAGSWEVSWSWELEPLLRA